MNINFLLFLLCATVVTGTIALLDKVFFFRLREPSAAIPFIARESRSLFLVFLIVFLLRSFLFQPFRVPTGSLEPTVMPGDLIAVNMAAYGLRIPLWHKKLLEVDNPKNGEIMLFHWPVNPKMDFVKRVIGVPGDHISYIQKTLYINGKKAEQHFVRDDYDHEDGRYPGTKVAVFEETLNGIKHNIYINPNKPDEDFQDLIVPPGHYFMMGDNRDNSDDSRYWGFVPDNAVIGRAIMVWFNWDSRNHPIINWHRIGLWL